MRVGLAGCAILLLKEVPASSDGGAHARARTLGGRGEKRIKANCQADTHVSNRLRLQHDHEIRKPRFSPPKGGGAFIPMKMPFFFATT